MSGILGGILGFSKKTDSDYELIATTFGTGSSAVIEFSSIPQNYKHLQVRFLAKNTIGAQNLFIRMNGVTSSVYARHNFFGNGTTVTAASSGSVPAGNFFLTDSIAPNSAAPDTFAVGIVDIIDYSNASKNTVIKSLHGQTGTINAIHFLGGLYNETTPVSTLTFTANANFFNALTRFSLYGING